jgi:hypothetical protein
MYGRIARYTVPTEKIDEAKQIAEALLPLLRTFPGLKTTVHFMSDEGQGLILSVYENKAAAGAAAPLVQRYWREFASVLSEQPRLEEFGSVWSVEQFEKR